jgi:predicted ribosome quality control (RQC) complex YloA/Tae2 family protein
VLYGETATANDYLTTKVARPSDYWFHVRGGGGAHVVLMTMNQPQRVQMPDLIYAAQLAKRHSSQKHSGYVSVDYTLKKYVRKPRGSAPGLAVYTHEKTLHLEE